MNFFEYNMNVNDHKYERSISLNIRMREHFFN